ncbi:MAG TPA: polyphosphate kinase 1 [Polyangiaceae bacterium]|jgi:polyphosphate kinase|nr:polyphosphate kinase 1 [Polyangiaceae bacterium]
MSEPNQADSELHNPDLYLNRELSWLAFNERVLDQACDGSWPLLERLKFLAIFGSNLDEFFMIRVSGLHELLDAKAPSTAPDNHSPREQMASIRSLVLRLTESAALLWLHDLKPELARQQIRVRSFAELSPEQAEWARAYFRRAVFPVLTPLAVDPVHPFPFLSNLSLSLAVEAENPETKERRFARIKVPESLPRFVPIEVVSEGRVDATDYVALEDLISGNLSDLFPGMSALGCYPFRVTRDMDLDILEEEAADLLATVDREIRKRRFGAAVRLEVSPGIPERIRKLLLEKLEMDEDDVYETAGPLGLSGLMSLAQIPRADLHDAPLSSRVPNEFSELGDPFATIRQGDVFLHHPYEAFMPVLVFLRRAAEDPNVLAIKMTLYRAGSNSEVVRSLMRAAENGKQVAVSIELKARFDEENNIGWARALERAGVHVFYGAAGLKTHAKVLLVVRREGSELRRYVHLSTGNYNATTARFYTDTALLTVDPDLGEDASELFNALSGFSTTFSYRKLAVAPVTLRSTVTARVREQAERARQGKPARIFAKLNALVDPEMIRELYQASRAGVEIELVVRGVCCLRPGVPGFSDRIKVYSLIGRFLEHERVFLFGPEGEEDFFLSSADWMPRNLDRRVEVLFPVASEAVRARIRNECLMPLELDNQRVYQMNADGTYQRRRPSEGQAPIDAQLRTWGIVAKAGASSANGSMSVMPAPVSVSAE